MALIDDREATLKTYRRAGPMIRLIPAHPSMAPIEVRPERLRIQGVVVGLMRPYVS